MIQCIARHDPLAVSMSLRTPILNRHESVQREYLRIYSLLAVIVGLAIFETGKTKRTFELFECIRQFVFSKYLQHAEQSVPLPNYVTSFRVLNTHLKRYNNNSGYIRIQINKRLGIEFECLLSQCALFICTPFTNLPDDKQCFLMRSVDINLT